MNTAIRMIENNDSDELRSGFERTIGIVSGINNWSPDSAVVFMPDKFADFVSETILKPGNTPVSEILRREYVNKLKADIVLKDITFINDLAGFGCASADDLFDLSKVLMMNITEYFSHC